MATVDPDRGAQGITAFVVERDTPGRIVGRKEDKLGVRASDTAEVMFDDVEVAASRRLGEEGEGYRQALGVLERGRIGIAALAVGIGRAALDAAVGYAAGAPGIRAAARRPPGHPVDARGHGARAGCRVVSGDAGRGAPTEGSRSVMRRARRN